MKIFVTGATGFVGSRLVHALSKDGHDVTCLIRDPARFKLNPETINVSYVIGDINDRNLEDLLPEGTETVFHVAAYAKPWSKDPSLPYKVNVEGTVNLLKAAKKVGASKFIHTSTAGVYGYSEKDVPISENSPRVVSSGIDYIDSKSQAERKVLEFDSAEISCIIVNPTRIYGPGPINESNSVTMLIAKYIKGRWRLIPGNGSSAGNYVYIDDVVDGHILAMKKGAGGESYILGGEDLDFNTLFRTVGMISGKQRRMIRLPAAVMYVVAEIMQFFAGAIGAKPLITKVWVERYLKDMRVSSAKAYHNLGYSPMAFSDGATKTINWIISNGI